MSSWLAVILVIVASLAVGFLRDSFRTRAIRRWCQPRGFRIEQPTAEEVATLTELARRFRPANASPWGIVMRKTDGALETMVAEHQEKPFSSGHRWHTIVATRIPSRRFDAVRLTSAPSPTLRGVTGAATAPGRAVRTRLGIEVTESPPLHTVGQGKWAVDAEDPAALAFWTSDAQAAAIDAWPHGGELAAVDDYVLFRVPGLMKASHLDQLLQHAVAARTFFENAAAASRFRLSSLPIDDQRS